MIRKHVQPRSSVFIFIAVLGLCLATMPGPAWAAAPWSFVIFGDTRGDWDPAKNPPFDTSTVTGVSLLLPQIAEKIAFLNPDFVLVIGDLIMGDGYKDAIEIGMTNLVAIPYADQFRAWSNAMSSVYAANIPIYTVRGNHEVSNTEGVNGNPDPVLAAAYYQALGQYMPQNYDGSFSNQLGLTYSFTHKQLTVVAMDQYAQYVAPFPARVPTWSPTNTWGTNLWGYHTVDQAWVSNQLHQANTPFKIVFAHEPIYEACTIPVAPNPDTYQWSAELYFGPTNFGGIARRQSFVDMLGANGVQLYAVGHVHNMSIGSFNDDDSHMIYQLTAGNGGASPMDDTDVTTNEPSLHGVRRELTKFGFTQVTVDPDANTMTMRYYILNTNNSTWSQESFSTQIAGSLSPAAAEDYDGDGKADPAVYDSANGVFTVFLSGSSYASSSVTMSLQSSAYSLQPIPGDFDGDRKADPAVYDPIAAQLLVRFSSQSYILNTMSIGNASCVPVSGDFDGDGKADPALYSAATGQMVVWPSGANYTASIIPIGGPGWLNASADYDGDGLTDPAVYEASSGTWHVLLSGSGYALSSQVTTGGAGVVPVPGDYDGDGKADLMVYQVASGLWLCALSSQGYATSGLAGIGGPTMIPRPGDYDNDGKTDPAVYDPVTRTFYVLLSGSNYSLANLSW